MFLIWPVFSNEKIFDHIYSPNIGEGCTHILHTLEPLLYLSFASLLEIAIFGSKETLELHAIPKSCHLTRFVCC